MIQPVFNIKSSEHSTGTIKVILETNADSKIFEGHFPGQPVVPGACMLQLVKDIVSDELQLPLRLMKADNIKFLGLVQPGVDQFNLSINYQIIEGHVKLSANLSSNETVFMKLQGTFAR